MPVGTLAQGQPSDQPGIDLSAPEQHPAKPDTATSPPPTTGAKPAPGSGAADGPSVSAAPIAPGEGDVALEDRVKAVQRKGFLKRRRFEVGLSMPATINDAFYEKIGATAKVAYNFEDSFALALHGTRFWQTKSSHVREGKQAFESQLLNSQLQYAVTLDGVWSPIYGKVAWLGSSIIHFDLYLQAGFGGVWTATSEAPRNEGWHVATDLGGGLRFYPSDWLALDAGVVGTFYPDQPSTGSPSTLQKVITAQIGVAIFFPFNFEYVYP